MRTKFFFHKLLEHPQWSGTSRQNSRDIPDSSLSLRNPRKTNFRGRARTFRPPPLRVEDPHPTGRSPDPKKLILVLFFLVITVSKKASPFFGPLLSLWSLLLFGSSVQCTVVGRTPRGSCNRTLLTRVLRRFFKGLDGQNRQSPIASVQRMRSTLASHSAVPHGANVKRMNANRAIRIAAQRTQGL